MGLGAYPFGSITCAIELASWVYSPRFLDVQLDDVPWTIGGSVTSVETAEYQQYRIKGVTAKRHTYPPYPCCPDESDVSGGLTGTLRYEQHARLGLRALQHASAVPCSILVH